MSQSSVPAKSRLRFLLILFCLIAGAGILLLPILKMKWEETQRIEKETERIQRLAAQHPSAPSADLTQELAKAQTEVENSPKSPELRLHFASLLGQSRRYKEAQIQLLETSKLAPSLAEPHIALSEVYSSNLIFDLALDEARAAVNLEPNNARALARLGFVLIGLDWNRAASQVLEPAVSKFPNDETLRIVYAQTLYQSRDYQGALREITEAKTRTPGNFLISCLILR